MGLDKKLKWPHLGHQARGCVVYRNVWSYLTKKGVVYELLVIHFQTVAVALRYSGVCYRQTQDFQENLLSLGILLLQSETRGRNEGQIEDNYWKGCDRQLSEK